MRSAEITLAVGVVAIAAVGALTLTRAPPRVVRAVWQGELVGREEHVPLALADRDVTVCQSEAVLPAGVSGIRVWLRAVLGVPVRLTVYRGSQVLVQGARAPDWIGQTVTVPVEPLDRASSQVRLCVAIEPNSEPVVLLGDRSRLQGGASIAASAGLTPAAAAVAGGRLGGRVGVEYLAPGRGSWWSRIGAVARHMSLGRAISGIWIAPLAAALTIAAGLLAIRLAARELP